eukprot:scaffold3808_cov170-Ochromonas_danica.AAC.7
MQEVSRSLTRRLEGWKHLQLDLRVNVDELLLTSCGICDIKLKSSFQTAKKESQHQESAREVEQE